MLFDAEETQDCLHLPSFHTSSQIGGRNPQREPTTRSFSPFPSPIRPDNWDLGEIVHSNPNKSENPRNAGEATPDHGKVVERNNRLNVDSRIVKDGEKSDSIARSDLTRDPGTASDTINSLVVDEVKGDDPDKGPRGTMVAKHVFLFFSCFFLLYQIIIQELT